MTPERFRDCLNKLGHDSVTFAAKVKMDDRRVRRWLSGAIEIPPEMGDWIERYAANGRRYLKQHPPPLVRRVET